MNSRTIKLGGVVAFVVLCIVAVWQKVPEIESGVVERAGSALDEAGIGYGSIEADGRIVKVSLAESSDVADDELEEALDVGFVKDIFRVERADTTTDIVAVSSTTTQVTTPAPTTTQAIDPVSPPELQIDVANGAVTALDGRVGSPSDTSALADLVGPPSGWNLVEDPATVAIPPGVLSIIGDATAGLSEGHISYTDGELLVTGQSTGAEASDRFRRLEARAASGFTATYDIVEPLSSIESSIETATGIEGIAFGSGTARISDEGKAVLDAVAEIVVANPGLRLAISGHTDSTGNPAANLRLSTQRAEAVAAYLTEVGVDPTTMTAEGFGDTQPIADNATAAGKAANRRIEFSVSREGGASS